MCHNVYTETFDKVVFVDTKKEFTSALIKYVHRNCASKGDTRERDRQVAIKLISDIHNGLSEKEMLKRIQEFISGVQNG